MKKNLFTTLPLKDRLVNKIMVYYQTIWAEKRSAANHKLWLANFKKDEELDCLFLLSKFMFFGTDEIRELLVSIFRDKFKYKFVEQFRKANGDTTDVGRIDTAFKQKLKSTRFVSLGGASESGAHILFLFRQVNKLSVGLMKTSSDIFSGTHLSEPTVEHYVFIDDFCGSGETAIKCEHLIKQIKAENPKAVVSYFVLFAASEGFENVRTYSSFDNSESIFILDNTFKCFEDISRYYSDADLSVKKTETKSFCTSYGYSLVKGTPVQDHPLGFNDGQLLLAFAHNTPDNTLPIFWSENEWTPMFVRYIKQL